MAKPGSVRQKEYEARKKAKDVDEYKEKQREKKRLQRQKIKIDDLKYKAALKKDRDRKRKLKQTSNQEGTPYKCRQSLGKAVSRATRNIPQTPEKKNVVLSKIVSSLSPASKNKVFSDARKTVSPGSGRPSISPEKREVILNFLQRPDVSYCMPGRKDQVYCGIVNGEKVFKPKHYLLWTYKEIKHLFDEEHDFQLSYHSIQKIVSEEKHLIPAKNAKDDDCRCEKCENLELMLTSVKASLIKSGHFEKASRVVIDPVSFISSLVCSIKNYTCCDEDCKKCPVHIVTEITECLKDSDDITYHKWVKQGGIYKKANICESSTIFIEQFEDLCGRKMKIHVYNIFRQFSELKHLKNNLEENQVILSVDFSKNYDNKQNHEIQSAYFGHEAFTLYTCVCYTKIEVPTAIKHKVDKETGLNIINVIIVSNETKHERNIAFSCNNKVIKYLQSFIPQLNRFFFWSDGCGSQFRSQYVFRSFCFYPGDIMFSWDYGEAHHFKGPHDGTGGTLKQKTYSDVKTNKVVIENAKHFAQYGDKVTSINVLYLDESEIKSPNVEDSVPIIGTLKIHHVSRVSTTHLEFFPNSNYKRESTMLRSVSYPDLEENSSGSTTIPSPNTEENFDDSPKLLEPDNTIELTDYNQVQYEDVNEGQWVLVIYEEEKFIGKVLHKKNDMIMVRCLEKPFGIRIPQDFEKEEDAIYYDTVYAIEVVPEMVKVNRSWKWMY